MLRRHHNLQCIPGFVLYSLECKLNPDSIITIKYRPGWTVQPVTDRFPKSPELTRNSAVFPKHSRLLLTTQRLSEMELFSLKSFSFIVMLFTCRNYSITPRSDCSLIFAKNKIYIQLRMSSPKYDLDAF